MKRTGFFLALLMVAGFGCLRGAPALRGDLKLEDGAGMRVTATACLMDELPWSVVDAVLREVDEETHYVYGELVEWYSDALLTVEQSGSIYIVRIYDEEGLVDEIIADGL